MYKVRTVSQLSVLPCEAQKQACLLLSCLGISFPFLEGNCKRRSRCCLCRSFKSLMVRALCWKVRAEFKEGSDFLENSIFGRHSSHNCMKSKALLPMEGSFQSVIHLLQKRILYFLILSKSDFFSEMTANSIWILGNLGHEGDEQPGDVGTEKFKMWGGSRSYGCSVRQRLRKYSFCKDRVVCYFH